MKKYEKRTTTRTDRYLVEVTCDLCGVTSGDSSAYPGHNWGGRYELEETCVQYREGTNYPEGGSDTTISCDICPKCFTEKLVPWLEAQGAIMQETEHDW